MVMATVVVARLQRSLDDHAPFLITIDEQLSVDRFERETQRRVIQDDNIHVVAFERRGDDADRFEERVAPRTGLGDFHPHGDVDIAAAVGAPRRLRSEEVPEHDLGALAQGMRQPSGDLLRCHDGR